MAGGWRSVLVLAVVVWMAGFGTAWAEEREALLERLADGGYVVYWRHAATDRRQGDRDFRDMDQCEFQRNLDARGRAQARTVGAGFVARGIPVGEVLTSDFCRNRETAEIAFGRYERVKNLWNLPVASASGLGRDALVNGLRERLGTPPADPSKNTVIVGHNLNLQAAARVRIDEGVMAVFEPLGDARFAFLGTLEPSDFE
jgi:phosphohistidine phosphatase SixA